MKLTTTRNITSRIVISLTALALFILPGCGAKSNSPLLSALGLAGGEKSGSTLISAATGGVVQLNDEVKLTVPAEALAEDLTISIERESTIPAGDADGLNSFGQAYRFLPKGTGFDLGEPAFLEMYYDAAELARLGLSPQTIQICYYDEELKCYVPVNCFVDTAQNKVTALIEHFTIYLPMAKALLPTNNEPYIGLQAPWPTTIRAGAPIYVRATVTDFDGSIAGVTLRYRKLQPVPGSGVWHQVRMTKEVNPQATLHTYGFLIPASFLTAADLGAGNDIEYRIEATDNLGAVQTSATRRYNVTLTYQPGSLNINPATLEIAAGFERFMLARGVDSNNAAFSLVPESFVMAGGSAALTNRFAQGILLQATTQTPAGAPDQLTVGFDGESASAAVTIHPGELESIEILDTNGISIPGDLGISEGTSYAFDVVGRDGYGNTMPIIPVWSADTSIGIMDPDGILDTTGCHGPGAVTASLAYSTDTQNVFVQSRAKEITAFSINGVEGVIAYPFITVTLPWGTNVFGLVASFTTTGQSVTVDGTVQESGVTANNFWGLLGYRVTAEDGSKQDYTVQVRMLSPYKDMTTFSLNGSAGMITGNNITVTFPTGTDVTSLVATFSHTGAGVDIAGIPQQSGVTANDFTGPVVYTVTAEDGTTRQYTVSIVFLVEIQGQVSHLAGSLGGPGYSDGTGQDSRFYEPSALASDGANVYVADRLNNTIRQINTATAEVTTLAGVAGFGNSTDGTGASARFYRPDNITTDGTNLYLIESGYYMRRIVIATGEVTTLATFPYPSNFNEPKGITTDGANLYVADTGNHVIRKIVIATGETTTIAGTKGTRGSADGTGAAALFSFPNGITTDGTYLYVTDTQNHTIRRITIETAEVTTIAGLAGGYGYVDATGSAARFYNPMAIIADSENLYINDRGNDKIRRLVIATGAVTTIATPSSNPTGIAIAGAYLFVADDFNHIISRIDIATRAVTTYAGMVARSGFSDGIGSSALFQYPDGVAAYGTFVYVADTNNCRIRSINTASGEVTTLAGGSQGSADGIGTAAQFYLPRALTTDGSDIYVADTINHTIRKINIATREVTTIAGLAGTSGSANGIGTSARFNWPAGITHNGTDLFVSDTENQTIRKLSLATGEVTTLAGSAGVPGSVDSIGPSARFHTPYGITCTGGNLFVSDWSNNTIRRIEIGTAQVTTLAGLAGSSGPNDGIGSAARFWAPSGITTDGICLYIVDTGYNTIRRIVITSKEVTTLAGQYYFPGSDDGLGSAARFNAPRGIAANGFTLYVGDSFNQCIRKVE